MTGQAIPQSNLVPVLHKVPAHKTYTPIAHPCPSDRLSPEQWRNICVKAGYAALHNLPLRIIGRTSFETLCRLYVTSRVMLRAEDIFEKSPPHMIIAKIKNSIWRTSTSHSGWNEIVDTWNGLKAFTFDMPDFETHIDMTTGSNRSGYAMFTPDTYLDGCLAFMLHHKNKHVLTLSFSIASGRRLLIQQIQTKNRRRNRWLYTLKKPLIAHAIACFRKAFPKHTLFLVNPEDLTRKSLDSYASSLACAHRIKTRLEKNSLPTDDICAHIRTTMEKRETLLSDRPRIIQKYRDAMPHISKTDTFSYNSMAHTLLPPNIPV